MSYKLLIVDDEPANVRLLERLFMRDYQCLTASNGGEAIRLLEQHDVAIIITDQRMPQMTGIELLKRTASLRPHMVKILLTGYTDVEALVEAINSGLVYMYFTKPWNNEDLKLKVDRACEHYENNKKTNSLALTNGRLSQRINQIKNGIASGLAEMGYNRGASSYEHAIRVRNCALSIASRMKLPEDEMQDIAVAAVLHELGYLRTTSTHCALHSMSDEARTHAESEWRLLSSIPELGQVADIISFQGENFDGTGYPTGLRNEQIPIGARIVRVADEYDSILRPNNSSAAMTHDEAMRFLSQRSAKQFDPIIVEVLEQLGAAAVVEGPGNDLREHHIWTASESRFEPSFVDTPVG